MGVVEERAHERRWWILAVLCFSLLVIVLDNSILNVAIPTIIRDLGATNSQIQWIVDSYTLVFAGLLCAVGVMWNRSPVLYTLGVSLLFGYTGSLALDAFGRALDTGSPMAQAGGKS